MDSGNNTIFRVSTTNPIYLVRRVEECVRLDEGTAVKVEQIEKTINSETANRVASIVVS
jgi:hypothetical protein